MRRSSPRRASPTTGGRASCPSSSSRSDARGPAPGSMPPLLEIRGLGKRFGAVAALEAVDLAADRGEVHAIDRGQRRGQVDPDEPAGRRACAERGRDPDRRRRRCTSPRRPRRVPPASRAVYQELAVLPELSVAENIWLGREPRTRAGPARSAGAACRHDAAARRRIACRSTPPPSPARSASPRASWSRSPARSRPRRAS